MAFSSNPTRHRKSPQLQNHLQNIYNTVYPSVTALETHFIGPDNLDLKRRPVVQGTGVFIDPTTIVTSATVVGRVFAGKPADDGSVVHRAHIAPTFVVTRDNIPLSTIPLAVSFAHDVAVLKLAALPPPLPEFHFPFCAMANAQPVKGNAMMSVVHMSNNQFGMMPGHVRAVGEKTLKAKAPWPFENGSDWVEFDNSQFNGGFPRRSSYLFKFKKEFVGSTAVISGSPLFNIDGEFFGIGSWDVREKGSSFPISFGASLVQIKAAVEYARTKKSDDPVVMDTWIVQG